MSRRERLRHPDDVYEALAKLANQDPPSVRWFFSEWHAVGKAAARLLEAWEKGGDVVFFSRKLLQQVARLQVIHQMIDQEATRTIQLALSLPIKTVWNVDSINQLDGEE